MDKGELRAEPRVAVSFEGTLKEGDRATRCLIQNMCSRGFLIQAANDLPVGYELELICHFPPDITCKVQVRHVNREVLGARVIDVSEEGHAFLNRYLDEQREA